MIKTTKFAMNSIGMLLGIAFPINLATSYADDPTVILRQDRDRIIAELDRVEVDLFLEKPIVNAAALDGKPSLGVQLVDGTLGIEVEKVISGSAADAAGIVKGDQIVAIDNADIESVDDVVKIVKGHPLNRTMRVVYRRKNKDHYVRIRFKGTSGTTSIDPRVIDESIRVEDLEDQLDRLRLEVKTLRSAVRMLISESQQSRLVPNSDQPPLRSID